MKSDDIKRSVRTQRYDRAAGDAPSLGKIARMPGTGLPKGERRRRNVDDGGRNNRVREGRRGVILIWSFLLVTVATAVLGVAVWLGMRGNHEAKAPPSIAFETAEDDTRLVRSIPKFPHPEQKQAFDIVRNGIAVRDPEKIAGFFRTGGASPESVVEFLSGLTTSDGETGRYDFLGDLLLNQLQITGVVVNFKGANKARNRVAFLTPDDAGQWKIDFAAFARTSTPSWKEIVEKGAEVAQVRVYAAPDNYFNGPFKDEKQWACFGVASPDTTELFMTYCRKGSPQEAALGELFSKGGNLNRVTLELRHVEGSTNRQFEISRVLAQDWVMGSEPFDERF